MLEYASLHVNMLKQKTHYDCRNAQHTFTIIKVGTCTVVWTLCGIRFDRWGYMPCVAFLFGQACFCVHLSGQLALQV
jgi:hypothetical protein